MAPFCGGVLGSREWGQDTINCQTQRMPIDRVTMAHKRDIA